MKKQFLLPMLAVVLTLTLAFVAKAYNSESKDKIVESSRTDVYFQFDQSKPPTEENVIDPANWIEVEDQGSCSQFPEVPCRIKVDIGSTDDNGPDLPRTLKSGTSITASLSHDDMYYVEQDGDVLEAYNRAN